MAQSKITYQNNICNEKSNENAKKNKLDSKKLSSILLPFEFNDDLNAFNFQNTCISLSHFLNPFNDTLFLLRIILNKIFTFNWLIFFILNIYNIIFNFKFKVLSFKSFCEWIKTRFLKYLLLNLRRKLILDLF